jgi:hypothetical protein
MAHGPWLTGHGPRRHTGDSTYNVQRYNVERRTVATGIRRSHPYVELVDIVQDEEKPKPRIWVLLGFIGLNPKPNF